MPKTSNSYRNIYAVVSRIPKGRIATYGQIARLAGVPGHARLVGYALSALRVRTAVPWHRVVNAKGRISPRTGISTADILQRHRLEKEGVAFDASGRIPLNAFQWLLGTNRFGR